MRIPLSDYDSDVKPAWLPIQNQAGEPLKPVIRCACGQLCGIGLHHVHADGRVTASFYHWWPEGSAMAKAHQGCGFHEFLQLDGYTTHPQYAGREFLPEKR